jgi:hypothetical protein
MEISATSSNQLSDPASVWQRLRSNQIRSCEEALRQLVDPKGFVKLDLLDHELNHRFFREFEDLAALPPVIPLLLWRSCFYIGSPYPLSAEDLKKISDRTLTEVSSILIAPESYRVWFRRQNIPNQNNISSAPLINPLTGETELADIGEVTDLYLSQAVDQTRRINALISVALQHRASDNELPHPATRGWGF